MSQLKSRLIYIITIFLYCSSSFAMSELEEAAMFSLQGDTNALTVLTGASDLGNAEAQMWLGTVYYANQSYLKAVNLFEKSSKQGNFQALFNLGRMYDRGLGVKKDLATAKKLYLLSAKGGNADAQHNVGIMYLLGDGIEKNIPEALQWLVTASIQGQRMAQRDLGNLFFEGNIVKRDLVLAYTYFSLAAANKEPSADKAAKHVRKFMSYSQISEAESILKESKNMQKKRMNEYISKFKMQ